jgi:hypothetical protein
MGKKLSRKMRREMSNGNGGAPEAQEPWTTQPVTQATVSVVPDAPESGAQGEYRASAKTRVRHDRALVEAAAVGFSQDPIKVPESEPHNESQVTLPPPAMEELYKQLVDLGEQLEGSQPATPDPSETDERSDDD